MAEYCVVDAQRLHLLPPGVDLRMGALVEPMSVAWHAVQIANVAPDHRVVILGAGPIGMGVYFALRARGVDQIAMVDMAEERLALARQSGVPVVVDGGSQDPGKVVMEWAAGTGLHHVIDAAGSSTALEAALGWLGFRGTVTVVALHGAPAALHPNALVRNELKVCGSQAYAPEDFDAVIQAMQEGHYDFTDWIDVVPLEGFEDAVVRLRRGKGMKTLICAPASC